MLSFLPAGGATEIGASCYYLNIHGTGVLLDCGIHPREEGTKALPNFRLLEEHPLDIVIISHAHQDHIGALPFLIQKFPYVKIYATKQTIQIAEFTLHNTVNILGSKIVDETSVVPYTHEEVDLLLRSINDVEYNEPLRLRGLRHEVEDDITVELYDAGHILGSASVLMECQGKRIFYTGDINLSEQMIMNGGVLPKGKVDILLTETTYGNVDSEITGTWNSELNRFANEANKVLNNGGAVLLPVFALGKTQELIASISMMIEKGRIVETDIYTGGIGTKLSRVYDKNRYIVKRNNPNLAIKDVEQKSIFGFKDKMKLSRESGFILASSGMMIEGTNSYKLAKHFLSNKNNAIFIVGYVDPELPSYNIVTAKRGNKIKLTEDAKPITVECNIERFYFTSHAKREELIEIVDKLKPDTVILLHGEDEARNWIGHNILEREPGVKVFKPEEADMISLY